MKKKKKKKPRNNIVPAMLEHCKGGPMKNKKLKRKNGKNKQREILSELDS